MNRDACPFDTERVMNQGNHEGCPYGEMMNNDPELGRRRPLRLKGYDYTQPGAYFVTICIQGRVCLLGNELDSHVVTNEAGRMVMRVWKEMPGRFLSAAIDEFIVMPNHVHGIVVITDKAVGENALSLGSMVGAFKSATTDEYIRGVDSERWQPFDGRLWQRNYYEHVVRDGKDLERIRDYISSNAVRWSEDPENPAWAWRADENENGIGMRVRR